MASRPRKRDSPSSGACVAHAHPHQLDAAGQPTFNVRLFILKADGSHGSVSLWGPHEYALANAQGVRLESGPSLFQRA